MATENNKTSNGKVIMVLLLIGFLVQLIFRIILAFSYIPETGGHSLDVLFGIIRMLSGRSLYTNPELPPYPVIQYMPLHYFVIAGVAQLFGVAQNLHDISTVNRLAAILFNLFLFIPVSRILKNIFEIPNRLTYWSSFFAIFLLLNSSNYSGPGSFYLLVLLFSVYYFLCFLKLHHYKYGSELVLSGIFGSLAFFTDQFGFIVQLATLLFLLISVKDRKATIRYAVSSGLTYLFLTIIMIGSSFRYWLLNVFTGLFQVEIFSLKGDTISMSIVQVVYLIVYTGLTCLLFIKPSIDSRYRFLRYLMMCILITTTAGRLLIGLPANYFEMGLILAVMLFIVLINNYTSLKVVARLSLIGFISVFILNQYMNKNWQFLSDLNALRSQYNDGAFVAGYVRQNVKNDEYIFTTFSNEHLLNLQIGEKALFPNREIVVTKYYKGEIFNYTDFHQRIKDGKIKYLIGKSDDLQPRSFLNQEFDGFEKESTIRGYDIYILKASR